MPKRKRREEVAPSHEVVQKVEDQGSREPTIVFEMPVEGKKSIQCERHGTHDSKPDLLFTHGAGGGLDAPAVQDFVAGFAQTSNIVIFKGNMNLKSRASSFQRVMDHEECRPALGGRSMGARAACVAAQESEGKVDALVLVSFPLIGAQKGDTREQTLLDLPEGVNILLISGTEDTMCDMDHLRTVTGKMKARSWIVEVEGADHGMASKKRVGLQPIRKQTGEIAAQWLQSRDESKRSLSLRWDDDNQFVVCGEWHETTSEQGEDGVEEPSPDQDQGPKKRKKTK